MNAPNYIYALSLMAILVSPLAYGQMATPCPLFPVCPQKEDLAKAFCEKGKEFTFDSAAVIRVILNSALIPENLDHRIVPIHNDKDKPLVWGIYAPRLETFVCPECFVSQWTTPNGEEILVVDDNSVYIYVYKLNKSSLRGQARLEEIAARLFPSDRFEQRKNDFEKIVFKTNDQFPNLQCGAFLYRGRYVDQPKEMKGLELDFEYILSEDFIMFRLCKAFNYGAPVGISFPRFSRASLLYSTIGGPTDPEESKKLKEIIRLNQERKKEEELQLKKHYAQIREAMQNSDLRTGFLRRLINEDISKDDVYSVKNNLFIYYKQPVQFYFGEQIPKISKEEQAILTESIWSNNPQKIVYALKYILALADHAESAAIPDFLPELMRLAYDPEFHQKCLQNTELAYWLWKILSRIGDSHTLESFKLHFNMNLTLSSDEEENLRRKKQRLLDELKEYQKTLEQNVVRNQEAQRRRSLNLAPIDDYNLLRCPFYRPKEDEFYIPLPLNAKSTRSNSRILTSLEGWFVEDCVLLGVAGDFVRLLRVRDDVELTIPIRRLSLNDQKYLRSPKAKADMRENLKRLKREKSEK